VGISRIYLGVHAINQVLLGWMYATYFIYIYYEYLDEFLEEKLTTIIYKNFNDKSHYWRFFSVYFGFYILAVLIGVFAFKIVDNNISRDELEKWETAVQIKNCEVKIAKFAHYKCFLDNQATAIIFGFFFSL
jgi:membrane-associated phospholipid phosphatase